MDKILQRMEQVLLPFRYKNRQHQVLDRCPGWCNLCDAIPDRRLSVVVAVEPASE